MIKDIEQRKFPISKRSWPGEVCDRCGNRNTVAYKVSDDLWFKVVGDDSKIRCLTCFDIEAQEKNINYTGSEVKIENHVSWSDWK